MDFGFGGMGVEDIIKFTIKLIWVKKSDCLEAGDASVKAIPALLSRLTFETHSLHFRGHYAGL
jgi:hypothetical protein